MGASVEIGVGCMVVKAKVGVVVAISGDVIGSCVGTAKGDCVGETAGVGEPKIATHLVDPSAGVP